MAWSPAAWQGSPGTPAAGAQVSSQDGALQPDEERSWLHYLAEISLRSIMDRVLADLYAGGESQWVSGGGEALLRCQAAYFEELESWHSHLPPQLVFPNPLATPTGQPVDIPSNELSFFLMTRYVGVMEWIHRPFLYLVLHTTDENSLPAQSRVLAQKTLELSATLIRLVAAQHRHGGIWGLIRRSFGAATLLISAARSIGILRNAALYPTLSLPRDWVELVELSLETIRSWEGGGGGANGLKRMVGILEAMLCEVKILENNY